MPNKVAASGILDLSGRVKGVYDIVGKVKAVVKIVQGLKYLTY